MVLGVLLLASSALVKSSVVRAGPVEQLVQLALDPADPNRMLLRYDQAGGGLVYTRDGGRSWQLICMAAIDSTHDGLGPTLITRDGHTLVGLLQGLYEDEAGGCGFRAQSSLVDQLVLDIAVDPLDPSVTYLAVADRTQTGAYQLVRRDAQGTYAPFGSTTATIVSHVKVTTTASGGSRFYESGTAGMVRATINGIERPIPKFVFRVSDDGAATFSEFLFGPTDGADLFLAGVDPRNSDRIVAVVRRVNAPDDVLVSQNRGQTFTVYAQLAEFGAITFAPDGRMWLGDRGDNTGAAPGGLWTAPSLDSAPRLLSNISVRCLDYSAKTDTLYACQLFQFGPVNQNDGSLAATFRFTKVDGLVSCPGADLAATCKTQLCGAYCGPTHFAEAPVCSAYHEPFCGPCADAEYKAECQSSATAAITADVDASAADAGPAASAEPNTAVATPLSREASCSATAPRPRHGYGGVLWFLALLRIARRRARHYRDAGLDRERTA
ncbi:MAG: hypothetical protein RL701_6797 [Pseudomonadota bacterium]